jgi:hypothetical protein
LTTLTLLACGTTPETGPNVSAGSEVGSASSEASSSASGSTEAEATDEEGEASSESSGETGEEQCSCSPGTDLIYLLSDEEELWSYDPESDEFALLGSAACGGGDYPYSMAVNNEGMAWILYGGSNDLRILDVNDPAAGCTDPDFMTGQSGFGLFGMSFVANSSKDLCERVFAHSYSGNGPFSEGPALGMLGVLDPQTLSMSVVSSIDYDGGELAGTGEGRLFAFAGAEPAKLLEYDKASGEVLELLELTGVSKTNASAFAFYGGDAYLFTEAGAADCEPCLMDNCPMDLDACRMDPTCSADLDCAIESAEIQDDCGGLIPQPLQNCMTGACIAECFPATVNIVSKVTRVDWDESDGNGKAISIVNPKGPTRVVGAANSICAPYNPP